MGLFVKIILMGLLMLALKDVTGEVEPATTERRIEVRSEASR